MTASMAVVHCSSDKDQIPPPGSLPGRTLESPTSWHHTPLTAVLAGDCGPTICLPGITAPPGTTLSLHSTKSMRSENASVGGMSKSTLAAVQSQCQSSVTAWLRSIAVPDPRLPVGIQAPPRTHPVKASVILSAEDGVTPPVLLSGR